VRKPSGRPYLLYIGIAMSLIDLCDPVDLKGRFSIAGDHEVVEPLLRIEMLVRSTGANWVVFLPSL
jgi:hypothetical protein